MFQRAMLPDVQAEYLYQPCMYHQHKLQCVKPPCAQVECVPKVGVQGAKFMTSINTIQSRKKQQHATPTTTDQLRISTDTVEGTMQQSLQLA